MAFAGYWTGWTSLSRVKMQKAKSKGTGGKARSRSGAAVDDDDDDDAPDAAAEDPDSADTAAWKWEDLRENALYALVQAVCCDFRAAWSMGMPEEVQPPQLLMDRTRAVPTRNPSPRMCRISSQPSSKLHRDS